MSRWFRVLAWCLLLVGLPQCARDSDAKTIQVPAGQVWLTKGQVQVGKLEIGTVEKRVVGDTIVTSGRITFDDLHVAHVFSPVSGRVIRIAAQPGQRVKKGDVLATIDSPDLGVASAELNEALADLQASQHEFDRQKELYTAHAGSLREYETAQDAFAKAKAEVERARQKSRLLRGAPGDTVSQGFVLRSPLEGEVVARNVTPGMEIQGEYGGGNAVELFTVGELNPIWLLADVYEVDLPRVKLHTDVQAQLVAFGSREFAGKVDWISETLDPATRTTKIRAIIPNPNHELKPEMFATVTIQVPGSETLSVPRGAILHFGETIVVFVQLDLAPDGRIRFERQPIQVDEDVAGDYMPVLHGLKEGERVVISGAILLSSLD